MSARVAVAPSVLRWAQERSQRDGDAFEKRFPSWPDWLEGHKDPTIKQVEEIARYSHLPFGVFFLDEPPTVELPIPDYRLGVDGTDHDPSQDLLDVIDLSVQRQAWFRDCALRAGLEPTRVTRATERDDPDLVAARVAEELRYGFPDRARFGSSREDARNHLRRAFEALGGLTIITSMVGNDNHRMLDRNEFRGFTLADEIAPLIFVNASGDSLAGQIFTFLHEYAHVVLRRTGISDEEPASGGTGVEAWCNSVAAEVLVPASDLRQEFRAGVDLVVELERLARRYLCSTLVILMRLRDLGLLPRGGFSDLYEAEAHRVR